jgi:photosystem II stability/assembly factor-like uncharacterized protein
VLRVRLGLPSAFPRLSAVGLLWLMASGVAVATPARTRITDHLYDVRLVTPDEGWVVGAFGSIYYTQDGGRSWRRQTSNSTEQLFGVDFADRRQGWAVGRSGLILATTDGGNTWRPQSSGTSNHLFKVHALDAERAWVIGDWGTILYTGNGGATWENRSLPRDVILNGQWWADAQHGWIVGEAGIILETTDGGASWNEQSSGVEKTLFSVFFDGPQRGWATGIDGLLLHTEDGGLSWQVQHGEAAMGELEQVGFADTLGNPTLYDVAVAGKDGYAIGENGTMLASKDGGSTWQPLSLSGKSSLRWMRGLSILPGSTALFVGAEGFVVRVADGQITPQENNEHASQALH